MRPCYDTILVLGDRIKGKNVVLEESMFVLSWCKAQVACLAILIYIHIMYVNDGKHLSRLTGKKGGNPVFNRLFVVAELALFFDGMTAWTVNCLE